MCDYADKFWRDMTVSEKTFWRQHCHKIRATQTYCVYRDSHPLYNLYADFVCLCNLNHHTVLDAIYRADNEFFF